MELKIEGCTRCMGMHVCPAPLGKCSGALALAVSSACEQALSRAVLGFQNDKAAWLG